MVEQQQQESYGKGATREEDEKNDGKRTEDKTEVHLSALDKHLQRQANILKSLNITEEKLVHVASAGEIFEKELFTPEERKESGESDPRMNFYPPFLIPECLALHYPFFLTTAIPASCKANRVGDDTYLNFLQLETIDPQFPNPMDPWDDSLGNVDLIADLKENQKLALLNSDYSRLQWVKNKCLEKVTYCYPALALPPALQRVVMDVLVGQAASPNELDKISMAYTDSLLEEYTAEERKKIRERIGAAATIGVPLLAMQNLFQHPTVIKNCQEALHYMFMHGFVRLIHMLTDVSLSDFVTYHGLTYRNRLNNPVQHLQVEGDDRTDYVIDTIYLYLVFCWQTAMDVWGQTLNEETLTSIKDRLLFIKTDLINMTYRQICEAIEKIVFPSLLRETLVVNIPDFVNQTQIGNFRQFINCRSNIPQSICPTLPTDFIPIEYSRSHPILWSHVFLLRHATFLTNHGCYLNYVKEAGISTSLCECNLCSPHRMPCYNPHLQNEIMTIGNVQVQGPESEKTFSVTPQVFANAYLKVFHPSDFFAHEVKYYRNTPHAFKVPMSPCVIRDQKLLALLRETIVKRESELLKRGTGVYLDPQSGELLSRNDRRSGEDLQSSDSDGRETYGGSIPHGTSHESYQSGRGKPERRRRGTGRNGGRGGRGPSPGRSRRTGDLREGERVPTSKSPPEGEEDQT